MPNAYHSIPDIPEAITSAHILVRLVDGLGFRYRWATEGLRPEDFDFKPCESSMTIKAVLLHIYQLIHVCNTTFGGKHTYTKVFENDSSVITETLSQLVTLSAQLNTLTDEDLKACSFTHRKLGKEFPF